MNGLNEQKKSKKVVWRKTFYVVSGVYLVIVLVLAILAYRLPHIYRDLDGKRTAKIKAEIVTALEMKNDDEKTASLQEMGIKNNVDLVVIGENGYGYKTTESGDFSELSKQVNERALSYHGIYNIKTQVQTYQIWLAVYQMEPQFFFEIVIIFLMIGVLVLFVLLSSLIFLMFKKLIEPIKRLKNNIFKLKEYKLNEVGQGDRQTEYDAISEELSEFTDDLQGKMDTIGMKYTLLEKELQAKQEKLLYKDKSIGTMVHHLKAPVAMVYLQLEQLLMQAQGDAKQIETINKAMERNQALMDEMKEIIRLTHEPEITIQKERMDVVAVVRETLRQFEPLLKKRGVLYEIDSPRNLFIEIDKIELKQLIYNIISNASQYVMENTSIEVSVFEEEEQLHIEVYNAVAQIEQIDFEHVFDLFYSVQGKHQGDGTGIGMYTIKATVENNHGICEFKPFEEGVMLTILLPLGVDFNE